MSLSGKKFYTVTCLFSSIFLILLVFLSSIPHTTVSTKGMIKKLTTTLFPQGWSFFTINPQLDKLRVYEIKKGNQLIEKDYLNSSSENLLGISKSARLKGVELNYIGSQIDTSSWIYCKSHEDFIQKLDSLPCIFLFNSTNVKYLHGDILLKKAKPIPFAWAGNKSLFMPCKIVKIHIYEKL